MKRTFSGTISQFTQRLVTYFSKKKKGSALPLQEAAKSGLGVVQGDAKDLRNVGNLQVDTLLLFSLELNTRIIEFEKNHKMNIVVSCHGYKQYPDEYPGQEKIQLFNIIS